jgi:hypothetical protein
MRTLELPGGTVLNEGDQINYRTTLGKTKRGFIDSFRNIGAFGWMNITDGKNSEWVSVAVQLQHIGEQNIKATT